MALKPLDDLCKVDTVRGVIVLESDQTAGQQALIELVSADARRLAINTAARMGLPDPRINGDPAAYPVDEKGNEVNNPKEQETKSYRVDIPVTARLV